MKKLKLIITLIFCFGVLFSIKTLQKNVEASVGYGVSKLCSSGELTSEITKYTLTGMVGYYGEQIGSAIGWLGGPAGAIVGGAVGFL